MPRPASVRWDVKARAWRSDVGPKGANGRNSSVYFREDDAGAIPKGEPGRRRASAALLTYLADRDSGRSEPVTRSLSVEDVAVLYLESIRRERRPKTVSSHAERLRWVLGHVFGDGSSLAAMRAVDLRPEHVAAAVAAHRARGLSGHSTAGMVRSIRACWTWAARYEPERTPRILLATNVLAGLREPRPRRPRPRYVPAEQAERLLDWIEARAGEKNGDTRAIELSAALAIRFVHATGCRRQDACSLTWADLRWDEGIAVLDPERHKTGSLTGREKVIPIPPEMLDRLRTLQDREGRHPEYVFTCRRGRGSVARGTGSRTGGNPWTPNALGRKFRQWRTEAVGVGLEIDPTITLHDFRRTMAGDLYRLGVPAVHAAGVLGDGIGVVDRIYASLATSGLVRDVTAVAEARRTKKPGEDGSSPGG